MRMCFLRLMLASAFYLLDDFHSSGRISGNQRMPLAKLVSGKNISSKGGVWRSTRPLIAISTRWLTYPLRCNDEAANQGGSRRSRGACRYCFGFALADFFFFDVP